jgi:Predicted pPIWI-associating nuclease
MTDTDDSISLPSLSAAWTRGLHAAEINLSKATLGMMNVPAIPPLSIDQAKLAENINLAGVTGPRVDGRQLGLLNIDVSKFQGLADTALGAQKDFATSLAPNLGFGLLGLKTFENGINAINTIARSQVHSLLAISAPKLDFRELNASIARLNSFSTIPTSALFSSATADAAFKLSSSVAMNRSISSLFAQQSNFFTSGIDALTELAKQSSGIALSPWIAAAPAVEPYSSARALAITSGRDITVAIDTDAESALTVATTDLELRLASIHRSLATAYRGAIGVLRDQKDDWQRQTAVSFRELVKHLVRLLAPNDALEGYFENSAEKKENGQFTRRSQLQYIFRNVAYGAYGLMAEKDIDIALATFFPINEAVHTLEAPLDDLQMEVLARRIEGCISVILAAQNI